MADGAEIFKRSIYRSTEDWKRNPWELNKDISAVHNLDIDLYMDVDAGIGWATLHNAMINLDAEYYNETPPVTADVKLTITNRKTGALVKGAYVALMSGATVIADGYTDGGEVIFENIDEGGYIVKVQASGYHDFEQSIEVTPPSVWYVIKIVPIPTVPIPDWVWWAVGGVAALGAITVIPSIIKRKGEEKVIVVR